MCWLHATARTGEPTGLGGKETGIFFAVSSLFDETRLVITIRDCGNRIFHARAHDDKGDENNRDSVHWQGSLFLFLIVRALTVDRSRNVSMRIM